MKPMLKGPVVLDRDATLKAMVAGNVIVRAGVHAEIGGMVSGDVIVEDGAEAHISAMVGGRIVGAPASVSGMVAHR